jgi:hypothetical protein
VALFINLQNGISQNYWHWFLLFFACIPQGFVLFSCRIQKSTVQKRKLFSANMNRNKLKRNSTMATKKGATQKSWQTHKVNLLFFSVN